MRRSQACYCSQSCCAPPGHSLPQLPRALLKPPSAFAQLPFVLGKFPRRTSLSGRAAMLGTWWHTVQRLEKCDEPISPISICLKEITSQVHSHVCKRMLIALGFCFCFLKNNWAMYPEREVLKEIIIHLFKGIPRINKRRVFTNLETFILNSFQWMKQVTN